MSPLVKDRPQTFAASKPSTHAAPQFVELANAPRFQTDLEGLHISVREIDEEAALMINPRASATVLLASAQARMQALTETAEAWLVVDGPDQMSVVLRPVHHLAQEVTMLLDAVVEMHRRGASE